MTELGWGSLMGSRDNDPHSSQLRAQDSERQRGERLEGNVEIIKGEQSELITSPSHAASWLPLPLLMRSVNYQRTGAEAS